MQNSYQFAFTKVFSLKSVLFDHSHVFRQSGYCRSQDLTSNSGGVFNAYCMSEGKLILCICLQLFSYLFLFQAYYMQQTFRNWDGLAHILITKYTCQDVFSGYLQPGCHISIQVPNRELPSPTESDLNVVVICAEQALFS